jgi:hypothetical protein
MTLSATCCSIWRELLMLRMLLIRDAKLRALAVQVTCIQRPTNYLLGPVGCQETGACSNSRRPSGLGELREAKISYVRCMGRGLLLLLYLWARCARFHIRICRIYVSIFYKFPNWTKLRFYSAIRDCHVTLLADEICNANDHRFWATCARFAGTLKRIGAIGDPDQLASFHATGDTMGAHIEDNIRSILWHDSPLLELCQFV